MKRHTDMNTEALYSDAVALLRDLIRIPSPSREEAGTAERLAAFLSDSGIETHRKKNNVWAFNRHYDPAKPTILLNSHHDTVRPNSGYTRDPYDPAIEGDRLYGLGSNDAGASVVSLLAAFRHFYDREEMKYNLCVAITAEEENSGSDGLECVLPELGPLDFAIVGEPTQMQLAIAERGLMVVDCTARGRSGHAAREEGDNAIYKAMQDIEWFRSYRFPKVSELFGAVKMPVHGRHPSDGPLHERGGAGRNPPPRPKRGRAPLDPAQAVEHPAGPPDRPGRTGVGPHDLRIAHDIGPGPARHPVAEAGRRRQRTVAQCGRIRRSERNPRGNRFVYPDAFRYLVGKFGPYFGSLHSD